MLEGNYLPHSPYILQSGKYGGKSLEYVLLHDISNFLAMKRRLEAAIREECQPNTYHLHLMWIVAGINTLAKSTVCVECGERAYYSPARGNYEEGYCFLSYPLCWQCTQQGEWAIADKFRITPWNMSSLFSRADRNRLWKAQKKILKINDMSDQQLFKLLVDI